MSLAKLVWAFIIFLFAAFIGGCVWFVSMGYEQLIDLAIEQLQRADIRTILENRFFTHPKFETARMVAKICIALFIVALVVFLIYRKTIWQQLNVLFLTVKNGFTSMVKSVRSSGRHIKIMLGVLLVLVTVRSVYYTLHFYPQFDECWNYNYFLSNRFFTTLVAYNNYPLHNVITFLFLKVLPSSTFVMRLPNIILGLVNTLLVFVLVKKIFSNEKIALVGAAIFCVLPTIVFYMLFARGVMLALFFSLLILHILFSKPIGKFTKAEIILLIFISTLGSFAMISFPVFLIVIFILLLVQFIIKKDKLALQKLFFILLGTSLLVLLFYAPMMLSGGFQLGFSSPHDAANLNWKDWVHKLQVVSRNQIGFFTGSYFFLLLNLILLFLTKRKKLVALNVLLLLIPFIFPLFTKIYFPARAIGFQVFAYLFTFCMVLEIILYRTNKFVLAAITVLIIVGFSYTTHRHTFMTWSAKPDKSAHYIAQIFQQKNITSYYDKSSGFQYFVPGILYHHKINGTDIQFFTGDTASTRFSPLANFTGNCFVESRSTFVPSANREILYEYEDVDTEQPNAHKDFVVYLQNLK